jgi:plastocyanin
VRRSRLLLPLAATLLLAGCAGDGGGGEIATEPVAAEDGAISITGTDRLRWDPEQVTSDTGELTIELVCEDAVNHNLVIDGEELAVCRPGGSETASVSLDAGEHEFVCTVPGHQRTMRGTITVE